MKEVTPTVHLIATPTIDWAELGKFVRSVGGGAWLDRVVPGIDEHVADAEALVEAMGRLCYRSWAPGLNPNVTKVRADTAAYLANLIASDHGAVLEHASFSFVFHDVSRVFTHELVRHRVGVAISQESLRYVRLDELRASLPACFDEEDKQLMKRVFEYLERVQNQLSIKHRLDDEASFATKKVLTSAFRRLAPIGLATTIGWTANARTLRHVVPLRTAPGAEAEMREVFGAVAALLVDRFPLLFGDLAPDERGTWRRRAEVAP